jgi:hypothetical protein
MKKALLILLGASAVAVAVYAAGPRAQIATTGRGTSVGTTNNQQLAFWGAQPTNQLTVTVATNGIDNAAATLKALIDALRVEGLIATN